MPRPKRSRFMGTDYSVHFVGDIPCEEDEGRFGETQHIEKKILIEDGMDHDRTREILLHEIIHQLWFALGIETDDHKIEETVATLYGRALTGHMRDNPSLWKFLLSKAPKE